MSKKTGFYKQCRISRGKAWWTAWVPTNLAVEGKTIVPKGAEPAKVEEVFHKIQLTHKQLEDYYGVKRDYGWDILV